MVVLGDDLNDVAHPEANARLFAGDEVIFRRVILKLSAYVNLRGDGTDKTSISADTVAKDCDAIIGALIGKNVMGQAVNILLYF